MCPICITTYVVYGLCSMLGLFGLKSLVNKIKIKYHNWSKTKCDVCKNKDINGGN